jgi:3-oxoacyl-ACP reductase-like protein
MSAEGFIEEAEAVSAADAEAPAADAEAPAANAEAPAADAEAPAADADSDEDESGEPLIHFEDAEWEAFRAMMAEFSKPVSFQQIFNNLRELRNQHVIDRKNEQLRTMIKQAIHNGILDRSGRGSRIYYSLKQDDNPEPEPEQ